MTPLPVGPDTPHRRDDFLVPENSVEAGDVDAEAAVSRFDDDKLRAYTVADGRLKADDIRGTGIVGRVEPSGSFVNTEVWVSVTTGLSTDTVLLACQRLVGYLTDLNISPTSALIADDRERSPDQPFTDVFAVVQRDGTCEPTDLQVDQGGPATEPTTSTTTTASTTTTGPRSTDAPATVPVPGPTEPATTDPPPPTTTEPPAPPTTEPPAPTTTDAPAPTSTPTPTPTTTGPPAPTTTEPPAPTTAPPTTSGPPPPTTTEPQTTSSTTPPPSTDASTSSVASSSVTSPP